eukprot:1227127-Prymnesium_polylepis.1
MNLFQNQRRYAVKQLESVLACLGPRRAETGRRTWVRSASGEVKGLAVANATPLTLDSGAPPAPAKLPPPQSPLLATGDVRSDAPDAAEDGAAHDAT